MSLRKVTSRLLLVIMSIVLLISLFMIVNPVVTNATTAWAAGVAYKVGDQVTYNSVTYQCLQAHTSLVGWEPPNVPALWKVVGSASPTPTVTNTPIVTPTATVTKTPTPTVTATKTPTPTVTATKTPTPTVTPTKTPTPTATVTVTPTPTSTSSSGLPKHILVGYWHNFDNGTGFIKLKNVSTKFDVINVAFGEPTTGTSGIIKFIPFNYTDADFTADVAYLKSIGKKVILSIGGANGMVQLPDTTARDNFVSSVTALIEKYGFDGLDIDFESGSLAMNSGDSDYKNPTTPIIVNLIAAIRSLRNHFGSSFMLTMAPETFYVQLGYNNYGGSGGAYLPVIYALRDILNWLQVQYYNSGPIMSLDDQWRNMGNADFIVAMADLTLQGIPLNHNQSNVFPALRPDQIVIGLPACVNAGNGFVSVAEVQKALDYIIKGKSFGGSYVLRNPAGYPGLRGLMTWSINWDAYTTSNFEFSNSHRAYLDSLP